MMMMNTVSLMWAGAAEKGEQSKVTKMYQKVKMVQNNSIA